MSLPLTHDEKEKIADIIRILYSDSTVNRKKNNINLDTVYALENALKAIGDCNHIMKILIEQLIGGSALLARGWLRKILSKAHNEISKDKIKLNGFGCMFSGALNHKSSILMTIEYGR
ncbi:MAG: hypothetical protein OQL19_05990 [Gammaproteobacteria bacterium]|nr:hypothetical protein [Gammaproteobacteria bacterium]